MDLKVKIKSLVKEAELYRSQGLLAEAKGIFENALQLIQSHLSPADGEKISKAITSKIAALEKEIVLVEKKVLSPDMTKESQDLVTQMFKPEDGEDENKAALEAAKALMKFGQFDRAVEELQQLLQIDDLRGEAAKHILNCFFLESKYDDALSQYEKWSSSQQFSNQEIEILGNFIQSTFKDKGIDKKIPGKEEDKDAISFDPDKFQAEPQPAESQKQPSSKPPTIKKPIAFDEEDEEFEEFDIMASIKKAKKDKKNNT